MLGNTVYFLDFKDECVKKGVVYDVHVTSSGYSAYQLLVDKSFIQIETSICYDTEELAIQSLKALKPLVDKITKLAKESQAKIDALREELLGKPTLSHLKELK